MNLIRFAFSYVNISVTVLSYELQTCVSNVALDTPNGVHDTTSNFELPTFIHI